MPAQPRPHSNAGGADEPARADPIDQPAVKRLNPCLEEDEQRERELDVRAASSRWTFCIGPTKSVQEYCRLAIMIIARSDATSWNQRLLIFTGAMCLSRSAIVNGGAEDSGCPARAGGISYVIASNRKEAHVRRHSRQAREDHHHRRRHAQAEEPRRQRHFRRPSGRQGAQGRGRGHHLHAVRRPHHRHL